MTERTETPDLASLIALREQHCANAERQWDAAIAISREQALLPFDGNGQSRWMQLHNEWTATWADAEASHRIAVRLTALIAGRDV
jgi:hypothetical protein